MNKERLTSLALTPSQAINILAGGSARSAKVLQDLFDNGGVIDPDSAFGGFGNWLDLDRMGIWDDQIADLFEVVCQGNLSYLIALLRADQLGQLAGVTEEKIKYAIAHNGEGIDMDSVIKAVKERLPDFIVQDTNSTKLPKDKIDLTIFDKAEVLAALFNASKPQGMGFMHYNAKPMTVEVARELLKHQTDFDYLQGRVMKIDLSDDVLNTWAYDRDNGDGAASRALVSLLATKNPNNADIRHTHSVNTVRAAQQVQSQLGKKTTVSENGEFATIELGLSDVATVLTPKVKKAKFLNKNK